MRHLDGIADDSFDVFVKEHVPPYNWVNAGHYADWQVGVEEPIDQETWLRTSFDLSGVSLAARQLVEVKLVATDGQWSGFSTFGQVAFDWIELLDPPPSPPPSNPCPCDGKLTMIDSVDIGLPDSEAEHKLKGWGEPEQATSDGPWGHPTSGTLRVTWEPAAKPKNGKRAASFFVTVPPCQIAQKLELMILDGPADDSFEVYINDTLLYTYADASVTEVWKTHEIDLPGFTEKIKVKIQATGPAWESFSTYGQLGVQWAKLYGSCAPD
jgi:hypothetical protein